MFHVKHAIRPGSPGRNLLGRSAARFRALELFHTAAGPRRGDRSKAFAEVASVESCVKGVSERFLRERMCT